MASRAAHPFEHATTHLVGGVAPDQVDLIFADLTAVQQMLSAADPQTSNLCDLHTHNIINQLIEGFASVHAANSPIATPTVPENDVSQPQPAQPPTVDASTHHVTTSMHHVHHVTPSQPAQPPTQTQTADTSHDASLPTHHVTTSMHHVHHVTPSQPAQPPTQTQTSDTAHDASPPPAVDPSAPSQPAQPPTQTQTSDPAYD